MHDRQFEFLDMLAIVSFALQMDMIEQMNKQATNDDIITHLHSDITAVDKKLTAIINHLSISLPDA